MTLISADVSDEVIQMKNNLGVKWAWLIEKGIESREHKDRIEKMSSLVDMYAKENEQLKNKVADLEKYLMRK